MEQLIFIVVTPLSDPVLEYYFSQTIFCLLFKVLLPIGMLIVVKRHMVKVQFVRSDLPSNTLVIKEDSTR